MALDKLVDSAQLDADLTTVANAIRTRGGTSDTLSFPSGMASAVLAIPSEGGGGTTGFVYPKDINFYDYDGVLLESWTLAELQTKTALPDYPTHAGLISQGWNWTLEALKTTNRRMNVGATYVTDDGSTRLYITIDVLGRTTMPLYFSQTVTNDVVIDWGDGSATETVEGTGAVNTSHTYTSVGDFVIKLKPTTGTIRLGDATNDKNIFGIAPTSSNTSKNYILNRLKKVELDSNVELKYSFNGCYCLSCLLISKGFSMSQFLNYSCAQTAIKFIVFPDPMSFIRNSIQNSDLVSVSVPYTLNRLESYAFAYTKLKDITLPTEVSSMSNSAFLNTSLETIFIYATVIGTRVFNKNYYLQNVVLSEGLDTIKSLTFAEDYCLTNVTIPSTVTSIQQGAFESCVAMKEYHFKSTTPPSLASATTLTVPEDCIIYVPQGCAEAYKAATNWATYADKIMEETTV